MVGSRVKVACRIRPEIDHTTGTGVISTSKEDRCVELLNGGKEPKLCFPSADRITFTVDNVFDQTSTQSELFASIARPLIEEAFRGFNCTLFSYGQTGSGKTYTLQGKQQSQTAVMNAEEYEATRGIVPRTAEAIFKKIKEITFPGNGEDVTMMNEVKDGESKDTIPGVIVEVGLSVMEIYQERLRDLLDKGVATNGASSWNAAEGSVAGSTNLRIREKIGGSVWVEGLTETIVSDEEAFANALSTALKKRVTGSHAMNSESSRSHLVNIINIRQSHPATGQRIFSKIHLIDLAGSEMVRKTDASGQRMKEAKHINKSLSALGNVINALTANNKAAAGMDMDASTSSLPNFDVTGPFVPPIPARKHVPYRDSKLTRLLQDSLGGNAKTVLILAIAASPMHQAESINTLRFGERARQLTTKPTMNTDIVADEAKLRAALNRAEAQIVLLTDTIQDMQRNGTGVPMEERPHKHRDSNEYDIPKAPEEYVCQQCAVVLKSVNEAVSMQSITGHQSSPVKTMNNSAPPQEVFHVSKAKNKNLRPIKDNNAAQSIQSSIKSSKSISKQGTRIRDVSPISAHSHASQPLLGKSVNDDGARSRSGSGNSNRTAKNSANSSSRGRGERKKSDASAQDVGLLGHWQMQLGEAMVPKPNDTPSREKKQEEVPDGSVWGALLEGGFLPDGGESLPTTDVGLLEIDTTHDTDADTEAKNSTEASPANIKRAGLEALTLFKSPANVQKMALSDPPTATSVKREEELKSETTDREDDVEAEGRCAVCGLNEEQADALLHDTGEQMGDMFMCDGNCGASFHVRCVGLMHEDGSYELPQGEWYCSTCTFDGAGVNDVGLSSQNASGTGNATSALVDQLKVEYHAMRRERNRILAQWQQEKRVKGVVEAKNESWTQKREEDFAQSMEQMKAAQAELESEKAESQRLRSLCNELMNQLENGTGSDSLGSSLDGKCVTREEAVLALLPKRSKLKRPTFHVMSNQYSDSEADASVTQVDSVTADSNKSDKNNDDHQTGQKSKSRASMPASLRGEVKKGAQRDKQTPSPKKVSSPIVNNAVSSVPENREEVKGDDAEANIRDSLDGARGSADNASVRSSLTKSMDNLEEYLGSEYDPEGRLQTVENLGENLNSGSSKLKGRLRDLLKTVQEEAGSYAEMRAVRQQRRDERMLKMKQELL
jgi:hypothetical protein